MTDPLAGPGRLVASFVGAGIPRGSWLLGVLEALDASGARYHKQVPAQVERVRDEEVLDREDRPGDGGLSTRMLCYEWEAWHREPPLSQEGLAGLRPLLQDLAEPPRGLRVTLGHDFPGAGSEVLLFTWLWLDGGRWEIRLSAAAAPGEGAAAADPDHARARSRDMLSLARTLYRSARPVHGALQVDAGVLPDRPARRGWVFFGAGLVERVGLPPLRALGARGHHHEALEDGGLLFALAPPGARDEVLEGELEALLAPSRRLPLEILGAPLTGSGGAGSPPCLARAGTGAEGAA